MTSSARLRSLLALAALVLIAGVAMQGVRAWSLSRFGHQVSAEARPGDIQMIASVTCPYCAEARAWFNAHQVPFTECMIERDTACAATYAALMAPGTPILLVRGHRQVGFNPQAVADALAGDVAGAATTAR